MPTNQCLSQKGILKGGEVRCSGEQFGRGNDEGRRIF